MYLSLLHTESYIAHIFDVPDMHLQCRKLTAYGDLTHILVLFLFECPSGCLPT